MNFKISTLAWAAMAALLLAAAPLAAQNPGAYRHMAPLASYLMPRGDEIRLARSAAPAAVSDHATVLVLTGNGYVTAAQGSNGFVCFVTRGPRRWHRGPSRRGRLRNSRSGGPPPGKQRGAGPTGLGSRGPQPGRASSGSSGEATRGPAPIN